mmetsp:Transcript_29532/g.77360  ORF Transcript_29532/g.77360 Transcript_29532/m.77360 type:complete len:215 (-) Transcript_29532:993-1637(-)
MPAVLVRLALPLVILDPLHELRGSAPCWGAAEAGRRAAHRAARARHEAIRGDERLQGGRVEPVRVIHAVGARVAEGVPGLLGGLACALETLDGLDKPVLDGISHGRQRRAHAAHGHARAAHGDAVRRCERFQNAFVKPVGVVHAVGVRVAEAVPQLLRGLALALEALDGEDQGPLLAAAARRAHPAAAHLVHRRRTRAGHDAVGGHEHLHDARI